jgi:transcriptional pleiotropic regulator of transition state genes
MKSFGIISKLDKSGGLKLPKMLMGLCDVESGNTLEMHLENDCLVMKKYPSSCIFCGSEESLKEFRKKSFCCSCADDLKNYNEAKDIPNR